MDALAGILDGPRARGAFVLRCTMRPPWSLRIRDEAPLAIVAMLRGEAWILPDRQNRHGIGAGDVAIVRGPRPYTVADDPGTSPHIIIHPGQRCTTPDGVDVKPAMDLGVRTWGNDPDGPTAMVTGVYERSGEVSQRLLEALPRVAVLPAAESPLIPLLAAELGRDRPGQEAVLDRLLDLLLITMLRAWFDRADNAPAWYRAHQDPLVGKALRLLHHNPAHGWTVAELAAASGASRAALARRFTEVVGEPPMAYLTNWRLTLAADLLQEPDATLAAVARQVGYGTPFALSTAFKRVRGVTPKAFRAAE